jgi:hypothetical protein
VLARFEAGDVGLAHPDEAAEGGLGQAVLAAIGEDGFLAVPIP